ncbi:demethylmenaquinone methyltransferase / 2-methoxy-6-polyprenyl-1,4-benzoquinol methylase [Melghirimyces thermohalophilus]|uniref:Demethylmenaquinone methyltransferase n=1 Tax=Melghirimyces thermohalophilus TaxID=1236220 RepID=A0A1G6LRG2_9BACL|nr:demethylmenaquinone methyltransferase [Melghirimyces thermohalophilus]SDC45852.1 demethylmenaquinone methyltransferase / 2-methoxy-6-polyprenyl-1,4-benzoquinol methylase [Melghirimyces thermohalophilus]
MHTDESKTQFVHRVFESIAKDYDRMNTLLSFRRHKSWRKFAMKKMNVQAGDTAIDVCSGTCDWAISLAEASGSGRVVGLDFSQNMLQVGEEKLRKRGLDKQVELVYGNAMELPYPDNTFDHATIGFALRNVPDYRHVLREMARVVKPGGQVVSLELSKPTWPPFRSVYYLYFQRILPFLGKLFADRYEQYRWLPESLVEFPDYQKLARIMEDEGCFDHVRVYPLTGGIAALHIGTVGD